MAFKAMADWLRRNRIERILQKSLAEAEVKGCWRAFTCVGDCQAGVVPHGDGGSCACGHNSSIDGERVQPDTTNSEDTIEDGREGG